MRTQSQIDGASALRIGWTASERKKDPQLTVNREDTRAIISSLLVTCLQENQSFYSFLETLFPQLGAVTKEIKPILHNPFVDHSGDCCKYVEKMAAFTPSQANSIEQLFRQNYPQQWAQLNSYATSWLERLMSNNLPGQGAPFSKSYWEMLQQGASYAYQQALKTWPNSVSPVPYIVDPGDDFIKKIYADGYGLVNSQITLNVLPEAMDSINSQLGQGKSWQEVRDELRKQFGETSYHWERLVRTEMANAANEGTMAQARELNEPSTVIKWSTSAGSVCPICGPRNGVLYDLDAPELQGLPHPNCMCVRIVTFRKQA